MPLTVDVPPKGIEKVLDISVSELIGHGALAAGGNSVFAVGAPLRAYHLGADAIAEGRGLGAAEPVGWIATLECDREALGAIELAPVQPARRNSELPQGVRFAGFSRGQLQRGLAVAVTRAAKAAGRSRVQASVLRAPALHLLALWLRDKGIDRLIPIAPAPAPLRAGDVYEADRALGLLAEAAKAALAGDDTRN